MRNPNYKGKNYDPNYQQNRTKMTNNMTTNTASSHHNNSNQGYGYNKTNQQEKLVNVSVTLHGPVSKEQLYKIQEVLRHPSQYRDRINYLAHHVSKRGVLPSKKNLEAIAQCPPPDTYTKVKSFVGLVGHYRHFIKGFANIAAPLYNLTSGDNKDKKSEHVNLTPEAREAFNCLKAACLQAPILSFPDFNKPFLLETDASGRGLGPVLCQKQADG